MPHNLVRKRTKKCLTSLCLAGKGGHVPRCTISIDNHVNEIIIELTRYKTANKKEPRKMRAKLGRALLLDFEFGNECSFLLENF